MKSKSWSFAVFISITVHFLGFFLVRIKTLEALQEVKFIQVGLYESSWSDRLVNLPGETEKEEEVFEAASQNLIKNDMQMDSLASPKSVDLPDNPAMTETKILSQKTSKESSLSAVSPENEEELTQSGGNEGVHIEGPAAGRIVLYHQEPDYPEWAQQYGLEFQIRLKFWIQASGEVSFVEIENSSGYPEVDAEVIQVMKRWRFNAVENAGMQWGKILFKFRLN